MFFVKLILFMSLTLPWILGMPEEQMGMASIGNDMKRQGK